MRVSCLIPEMAGAFNDDNGLQSSPFMGLIQRRQLVEGQGPHQAMFDAMMTSVGGMFMGHR